MHHERDFVGAFPGFAGRDTDRRVRLPTRIANVLSRAGVRKVGEIREYSDKVLTSFPDMGRDSVTWLREKLG